jgi:hypothetical protein
LDWPVVDATGPKEAVVQVVSDLVSHAVR